MGQRRSKTFEIAVITLILVVGIFCYLLSVDSSDAPALPLPFGSLDGRGSVASSFSEAGWPELKHRIAALEAGLESERHVREGMQQKLVMLAARFDSVEGAGAGAGAGGARGDEVGSPKDEPAAADAEQPPASSPRPASAPLGASEIHFGLSDIQLGLKTELPAVDLGPHVDATETPRFWIYASHHKAGTEMLRLFAKHHAVAMKFPSCAFNTCEKHISDCGFHGFNISAGGSPVFYICNFNKQELKKAAKSYGGAFRLVQIVRNPVSLVASGYAYHITAGDIPSNWQKKIIGLTQELRRNITKGVIYEAEHALTGTLSTMLRVSEYARRDERVLTMRFEDFQADFNASAKRLYTHMLGGVLSREEVGALASVAGLDDIPWDNRNQQQHFTSSKTKERAQAVLMSLANLTRLLSSASVRLGYDPVPEALIGVPAPDALA